jgi:predicted nucleotidyltransferase
MSNAHHWQLDPKLGTIEPNMGTHARSDPRVSAAGEDPVAAALFGKTRRALLAALFGSPHRAFFLRELSRLAGGGLGSVQRELRRLHQAGLVTTRKDAGRTYYQADSASPLFRELVAIVRKTAGIGPVVAAALRKLANQTDVAFIYGSVARGEQEARSDVDVMVIGSAPVAKVVAALRPLAQRLGREVNPSVYPPAEFRRKLRTGNHFLTRVMEEPKIFVLGGRHELEAVAG